MHTPTANSQASIQTKKPKLYSSVATANLEKSWTVVGTPKLKSRKTQGSSSFPTPLKTPRPEHERRIIFRRRTHVPPLAQDTK
ncbi:hypothetical protein Golomagni_04171 [Golovinomyces magnicellulatus]|nr:hypothetical protein Golomagni_04171 [Golovinomyces magnicellulatus]